MPDSTISSPYDERPPAHRGPVVHVSPVPVLLAVFAALMVLTYATVAVRGFDLGPWNLLIAMGIATVKASLVALYFMHLRYDKPFHAILFVVGVLFVALFISLTLLDTLTYQPDVGDWGQTTSLIQTLPERLA
jgi:cytochrome c oxidase subunit 4